MNQFVNKNTLGQSGFYFFFGVVENRNDPMRIGRVQVRCYGIHDDDLGNLPTDHLPWATVIMPTTSSESSMPSLYDGCNVFGFFADGQEMQIPMITGVIPGIVGKARHEARGFYDQRAKIGSDQPGLPTPTASGITEPSERPTSALNQSSLSAYAIQGKRLAGDSKSIQGASNALFTEPVDPYNGKYPFVQANESESGHVIELDDTPGDERVHVFHRAGSYVEMHADGTVVHKAMKDGYNIIAKNGYVHIGGDVKVFVNGGATISVPNGDVNINVKNNINVTGNIKVSGDVIASGISLVNHVHGGVRSGNATTGSPV
jgi:Gp5 N-terminal OB domain/GpV Apex motif